MTTVDRLLTVVLPNAEPWVRSVLTGIVAGSSESLGDLALLGITWMGGGIIAGGTYTLYINTIF